MVRSDVKSDQSPICLVRPPAIETFRFSSLSVTPPLGLAYVAGALEAAGENVVVVDAVTAAPDQFIRYFKGYLIGLTFDEVARRIPADAKFVGITVVFTHEWPAVVKLIDAIKRHHPALPIVLGGEHVTSMPEFCLRTSQADVLVLGEGEETLLDLVRAFDEGLPLDNTLGVAFRTPTDIVVNARRARTLDIDEIAWPAWHLFDLDVYHSHKWMGGMYSSTKSVPILATRGCPYQCTYCSAPNMWTPRWIPRTPAKVVDEIQYYVEKHGARNFPFQDLTAIIRREWIVDFCNELLARNLDITWQMPTGTRSEAIDEEVADLLHRTGMISMAYAPESGSEETRKLIKKRMKTDRMYESMRAAVGADLNVMVFMVLGFPHDTRANLRENLPFMDGIAEVGITDAAFGFYMALPGTQIFDSLYDSGQVTINRTYFRHILSSTSLWATSTYSDLSRAELTLWKLRLTRRFYNRKAQLAGESLVSQMRTTLFGGGSGGDESKLQTAFRNGVDSAIETAKSKFRRGWVPRAEEREIFDDWDRIFREIRARQLAAGVREVAPADTRELQSLNVIKPLQITHGTRRTIPVHV
jgi:anaerobic magnesium-protoporphyrin IX monomethyl ester cyclase